VRDEERVSEARTPSLALVCVIASVALGFSIYNFSVNDNASSTAMSSAPLPTLDVMRKRMAELALRNQKLAAAAVH